jgi:hypothetical protein
VTGRLAAFLLAPALFLGPGCATLGSAAHKAEDLALKACPVVELFYANEGVADAFLGPLAASNPSVAAVYLPAKAALDTFAGPIHAACATVRSGDSAAAAHAVAVLTQAMPEIAKIAGLMASLQPPGARALGEPDWAQLAADAHALARSR